MDKLIQKSQIATNMYSTEAGNKDRNRGVYVVESEIIHLCSLFRRKQAIDWPRFESFADFNLMIYVNLWLNVSIKSTML